MGAAIHHIGVPDFHHGTVLSDGLDVQHIDSRGVRIVRRIVLLGNVVELRGQFQEKRQLDEGGGVHVRQIHKGRPGPARTLDGPAVVGTRGGITVVKAERIGVGNTRLRSPGTVPRLPLHRSSIALKLPADTQRAGLESGSPENVQRLGIAALGIWIVSTRTGRSTNPRPAEGIFRVGTMAGAVHQVLARPAVGILLRVVAEPGSHLLVRKHHAAVHGAGVVVLALHQSVAGGAVGQHMDVIQVQALEEVVHTIAGVEGKLQINGQPGIDAEVGSHLDTRTLGRLVLLRGVGHLLLDSADGHDEFQDVRLEGPSRNPRLAVCPQPELHGDQGVGWQNELGQDGVHPNPPRFETGLAFARGSTLGGGTYNVRVGGSTGDICHGLAFMELPREVRVTLRISQIDRLAGPAGVFGHGPGHRVR